MAMVNNLANVKDSRWLQLEVCREYQRNKCTRPDTECKFAHPPANVEVQNGRVIACYDSIKGRCNREKPPCKYFHPPQHLKDQLLINGRNHLALKNALLQQMPLQPVLPGQLPTVVSGAPRILYSPLAQQLAQHQQAQQHRNAAVAVAAASLLNGTTTASKNAEDYYHSWNRAVVALHCPSVVYSSLPCYKRKEDPTLQATTNPYMPNLPTVATASSFGSYLSPNPMMPGLVPADAIATPLSVVPTQLVTPQKAPRTDRLEVCREFQRGNCKRAESDCRFAHPPEHVPVDSAEGVVTVCMDFVKGRCTREQCRYFHPPPHLQAQLKAAQSRANAATMPHVVEVLTGKKRSRDPADDFILAFPGMVPYTKRPAFDKSGLPVYQPGTTAYQQALAMQVQQSFVPVSFTGHPASVPRF